MKKQQNNNKKKHECIEESFFIFPPPDTEDRAGGVVLLNHSSLTEVLVVLKGVYCMKSSLTLVCSGQVWRLLHLCQNKGCMNSRFFRSSTNTCFSILVEAKFSSVWRLIAIIKHELHPDRCCSRSSVHCGDKCTLDLPQTGSFNIGYQYHGIFMIPIMCKWAWYDTDTSTGTHASLIKTNTWRINQDKLRAWISNAMTLLVAMSLLLAGSLSQPLYPPHRGLHEENLHLR